jgi:hypothetical protein
LPQLMSSRFKKIVIPAILALLALMIIPACSEEFHGVTYSLDPQRIEVALPVNASSITLILQDKAQNFSLANSMGENVGLKYNSTYWQGEYTYDLAFDKPTLGTLSYILPSHGQQFVLALKDGMQVRVVLPAGYSTGEKALGIAKPDPDYISTYSNRTALIWSNPSRAPFIEVDYYRSTAPDALKKTFLILLGAGLMLLIEYRRSIRKLRSMDEDVEKGA